MLLVPEDDEPVTRKDINLIMLALMKLGATMEEIRDLLSWRAMVKTRKNLGPEEIERIRAGIEEVQRELRQIIDFLQAKLDARKT